MRVSDADCLPSTASSARTRDHFRLFSQGPEVRTPHPKRASTASVEHVRDDIMITKNLKTNDARGLSSRVRMSRFSCEFNFLVATTGTPWGAGTVDGSFSPRLIHQNEEHRLMPVYGNGSVEVVFAWMRVPPFSERDSRLQLMQRLNAIDGVSIPGSKIDLRPSVALTDLAVKDRLNRFLETFDWAIDHIRQSQQ